MREPVWQAAARALCAGKQRVLCVGSMGFGLAAHAEVALPADAHVLPGDFDVIVWQPRGELARGLELLKRRLLPGGRLVVWVDSGRAADAFLRVIFARRPASQLTLEEVCEALLRAGLVQPQSLSHGKRGHVVTASQPAMLGMLDALFSQQAP